MIAGPMVPTADVAREIYLAVAKGQQNEILPSQSILVRDDGDRWAVFRPLGQGRRGGGTLDMTIDKCDGSILVHYSR